MTLRNRKQLRDATGAEIVEETIVIAITSFVAGPNHEYAINQGMRLRASHPAVAFAPSLFAADGTSDDEIRALGQKLIRWFD